MEVTEMTLFLAANNTGAISTTQTVLIIGVVLSLLWAAASSLKRMKNAGRIPQPSIRELNAVSEKTKSAARDLEELMTELDQLSHQLHGRIDAKIEKLATVIKLADERIDQLQRLSRAANHEPTIDLTIHQDEITPPPAKTTTTGSLDQRHASIYQLADGGLSPLEIASETNKPAGEIELILALRKARSQAADRSGILQTT